VILVCAATRTEAAACRRGIADAGAPDIEVLTTGVGPARAAAALARRLRTGAGHAPLTPERRPALVVSSGFAGALTAGLAPLDWVTSSSIHRLVDGRAVELALPPGALRTAVDAIACRIVSAEHAIAHAVAGVSAPAAVDMESAALAEVAAAAGLPFLVLRLLTDTPARPLPAVGRALAATLAAAGALSRAAHCARAALDAALAPTVAAAFVRDALRWRAGLRAGWREHARRGVPARPRS
jgi:nucleoside phosphorylase